jgi:hypothetical protein
MKKLFLVFSIAGLIAACDSNKRSSNGGNYTSAPTPKSSVDNGANANSVNPVNQPAERTAPKTHLDSMLMHSAEAEKQSSSYNRNSTYHNGASGVGTGSSYAGHAYAKLRYKKKPKPVRKTEPSMEEELTDNNRKNIADSTGSVKEDSASLNRGW